MLSTLKQPNRFEYNFPALWLKPLKCGVCANELVLKSKTNHRRPLLMKCNHTVCDKCCIGPRPLILACNLCNEITRVERHQALREILETHYYLLGVLSYKEYNLNYDISFVDSKSPNEKRLSQEKSSLQECSECTDVLTNFFCIQCSVPYCKNCFENVHKQGKALQRHCLSQFDNRGKGTIQFDDKKCRRHNNFIQKYCLDCKLAMCVLCVLESHARHKVSSLADENQKSLSHVASLMETVKAAKETNKQAQKMCNKEDDVQKSSVQHRVSSSLEPKQQIPEKSNFVQHC